jgi:hypothetical protein
MQEWKKERSAGGKRRKPSKTRIIREIRDFLSDTSDLTGMIWEITDDLLDIDQSDLEEIVEALREASLRINTMIKTAFHSYTQDDVLDQVKEEVKAM